MGKLTFLFVFALIALQGSNGAFFKSPRNEIEDLLGEILEAINEVNQVIEFIGDHISSFPRDYEHEINEIEEEFISFPELEDLKESIKKIESEVTDDPMMCIDSTWRMVTYITDWAKQDVDNCDSKVRPSVEDFQYIVQSLEERAANLRLGFIDDIKYCMKIGNDPIECVKNMIYVFKQNLVDLSINVEYVQNDVHTMMEDEIKSLRNCLDEAKDDLILSIKVTLDGLIECLSRNN